MGDELNGIIFLSVGKMPLINLSVTEVPRSTGTAKFLLNTNWKRMRLFPGHTYKRIIPMTFNLCLVTLFSCGLPYGCI